ncbi:hypothetical protein BZA70DRAFT_279754 [Myxozyma melibiosi]|uniref:Uncharacterized protein n=1 Tax=Myxozyma melibiosi TaxID=54550 RepID=A0ABR1F4F4_9ASCO
MDIVNLLVSGPQSLGSISLDPCSRFDYPGALSRARELYPYHDISPTPLATTTDLDILLLRASFAPLKPQQTRLYLIADSDLYRQLSATICDRSFNSLDFDLDDSIHALLIRYTSPAPRSSLLSLLSLEMHLACVADDDDARAVMDACLRSGGPLKYALKTSHFQGRRSLSSDATLSFSFHPETMTRAWCAAEVVGTNPDELRHAARLLLLERASYAGGSNDWRDEYYRVDAVVSVCVSADSGAGVTADGSPEYIEITWWRATAAATDIEAVSSQWITPASMAISFDLLMMGAPTQPSKSEFDEFRYPGSWMARHSKKQVIEVAESRVKIWVRDLLQSF